MESLNDTGSGYTQVYQASPLSDTPSCRILVVSPSLEHAGTFTDLLKSLGSPSTSIATRRSIPWTIQNKYYTAPVHFELHDIEQWRAIHAQGVPAIVFVWKAGEKYQEHILHLEKQLSASDPEVLLAVRIASNPSPTALEDEGTDEFLLDHGFEFIEARTEAQSKSVSDDIPGITRALDALSTIMWPSMSQGKSAAATGRERELYAWAQDTEEDEDSIDPILSTSGNTGLQKEMQELERWLEDEAYTVPVKSTTASNPEDPWARAAWSGSSSIASSSTGGTGFDDDFTVFVSAPAPSNEATDEDQGSVSVNSAMLLPTHTGASYASLGSVSDFGGSDHGDDEQGHVALNSDEEESGEDEDLPSHEEIRATSARIFGALSAPTPSTTTESTPSSPIPTLEKPLQPVEGKVFDEEEIDFSAGDFDLGAFDLSRVLGALQGMKAEIAGMDDEAERRKAAARVALGLVYGLERDAGAEP